MSIRAFKSSDIEEVKRIFDKFGAVNKSGIEFEFPDMTKNYLCAFIIEDDDKKIITAGGVAISPELRLTTDMNLPARVRLLAVEEALQAAKFICYENRFNWLSVVTDDPIWADQIKKRNQGFVSYGDTLVIHIGDIK